MVSFGGICQRIDESVVKGTRVKRLELLLLGGLLCLVLIYSKEELTRYGGVL